MARVSPLKDLCQIKHGGTPSKSNSSYWAGAIPWVSPKDMKASRLDDTTDHISTEAVANSAASIVPEGSILVVVRSGILAHTLPVAQAGRPLAFNQDIKALLPDPEKIDADYLYWFMRSSEGVVLEQGVKKGATVHSVRSGFIENLRVMVPSLDEQRSIVDLLSRAEGIVHLRRQAQKKAAEIIPALFLDMFGDPAANPKGWPTKTLSDLCNLVRGSSPRPQGNPQFFGGNVPRLMIADITRDGVYVSPRIDSLTDEGAKRSRPMRAGDVVMAVSGAVGLPAILAVDACIHDGFVGFRSLCSDVSPQYLYYFLITFRKIASTQAVGATFQNLKTDQIRVWRIPIPSRKDQLRFVTMVENVDSLRRQQTKAAVKAEETFNVLLSRTFADPANE